MNRMSRRDLVRVAAGAMTARAAGRAQSADVPAYVGPLTAVEKGTRKFRPGAREEWYLPRRSTTQAFCWGTTLIERVMKIAAMTNRMTAISMTCRFVKG